MAKQIELWASSDTDPETQVLRPIHYLGSKLRLVETIGSVVDAITDGEGRICDLFAGSGTVATYLARSHPVVAVDVQEYSRVLCAALLSHSVPEEGVVHDVVQSAQASDLWQQLDWAISPLATFEAESIDSAARGDLDPLCNMLDHGSILAYQLGDLAHTSPGLGAALSAATARLREVGLSRSTDSIVTRHFGGVYFSFTQALWLDVLLAAVFRTSPDRRDALLAPILSTASECVNTVGKHFAQPIRPRMADGTPKRHLLKKIQKDRAIDPLSFYQEWCVRYATVPRSTWSGEAVKDDYAAFLGRYNQPLSAIYADPPYTRDHYSRYYHVLETMCLRDDPDVTSTAVRGPVRVSRGVYRKDRHQSPFCIRTKAASAFAELFAGARKHNVPLVVSYSPFEASSGARPRLMTVDGLVKLAREQFSNVEVVSPGRIAHSKLRATDREVEVAEEAEVLVVCRP